MNICMYSPSLIQSSYATTLLMLSLKIAVEKLHFAGLALRIEQHVSVSHQLAMKMIRQKLLTFDFFVQKRNKKRTKIAK